MTQQIKETHITKEQQKSPHHEKVTVENISHLDLADLWMLADYLAIPDLQNKAIDMLAATYLRLRMVPSGTFRNYTETMPGSMLRKLLVDRWCWA